MPTSFAYGANLDAAGMAERCPGATPLGAGCLTGWQFFIMANGWASIRPMPRGVVHGLLWHVPEADEARLDAFEDVGAGLYRKEMLPVAGPGGIAQALVYVGSVQEEGRPRPGYLEAILDAGRSLEWPPWYRNALVSLAVTIPS